jgi:antiviral helicase SLH1
LILVVIPRRGQAAELLTELRLWAKHYQTDVVFANDTTVFSKPHRSAVRFITSEDLLKVLSSSPPSHLINTVDLVILEHLELLHSAYELSVSMLHHAMRASPSRLVCFSRSLYDVDDLASWLAVEPLSIFTFGPDERSEPLTTAVQPFTRTHSGFLLKSMAKHCHRVISEGPANGQTIVFVPSRSQCRTSAYDLITESSFENYSAYLPNDISEEQLEAFIARLQDSSLSDIITRGVGIFHSGIGKADRLLMLEMYAEGVLRVIIVPREACWSLPLQSPTVVVMGTQYIQFDSDVRQVRDYDLQEIVQMQSHTVSPLPKDAGRFYLFCHAGSMETIVRFLKDGLPLESQLLDCEILSRWCKTQYTSGWLLKREDLLDALSYTFLAKRVTSNPAYYGFASTSVDENLSFIVDALIEENKIEI